MDIFLKNDFNEYETDSPTTSTSTYEEPNDIINNEIINNYYDSNLNKYIDDNLQLSILRKLNNMNKNYIIDNIKNSDIQDFFLDNSIIDNADFFNSDAGIKVRKIWYNLTEKYTNYDLFIQDNFDKKNE